MPYDIAKARQAGVSDQESVEFLAKQTRYNLQGARAAGVPQDEILNALLRKTNSVIPADQPPAKIGAEGFGDAMREVAREHPIAGRLAAGATTIRNVWEGAKQLVGKEDKQAIQAQKVLADEYPGAAFTGGAATFGLTAAIPGANTVTGAAVIGGATGFLSPADSMRSRMTHTATNAVLSAVSQKLGNWAAKWIDDKLAAQTADLATQKAQNAVKDAVTAGARKAGYKVPPSQANAGTLTRLAEGFAGKIQTAQKASEFNQANTNRLARIALDIPEDTPLSSDVLEAARSEVGKAYEAIKAEKLPIRYDEKYLGAVRNLSSDWQQAQKEFGDVVKNRGIDKLIKGLTRPRAAGEEMSTTGIVETTRVLRRQAAKNIANWQEPDKQALGYAQRKASDALEALVDRNLAAAGKPGLVKDWQAARQWFAKSYDVEAALNDASGNVSARVLARLADKGKPLSGELAQIARFAKHFPKAAQDVERIGSRPPISPLDVATAAISGKYGAVSMLAGRPLARAAILSRPVQNAVTRAPDYAPSLGLRIGDTATNPYLLRAAMGGPLSTTVADRPLEK